MDDQPLAARLRAKRSELMVAELEAVALRLFDERGFERVTVDDIASEAHISVRTFYRHFPAKEDVLQVNIDRRSDALRFALSHRPVEEPPLRTLRLALVEVVSAEDPAVLRRWIAVIAATPSVLKSVLGGIQLKSQRVIAEFLATRLALPSDGVVPTTPPPPEASCRPRSRTGFSVAATWPGPSRRASRSWNEGSAPIREPDKRSVPHGSVPTGRGVLSSVPVGDLREAFRSDPGRRGRCARLFDLGDCLLDERQRGLVTSTHAKRLLDG